MPEADETIITRIIIEGAQAIKDAQSFRAEVEKIKEEMKKLSAEGKVSVKDLANAMSQQARQIKDSMISALREAFRTNDVQRFAELTRQTLDPNTILKPEQFKSAVSQINQSFAQTSTAIKTASSELAQGSQAFRLFGVEINNVGDIAKAVFLGIFGVSVVTVLRNVVNGLKEATQAGYEFGKAIFQLEIGARALQRAGTDITIAQIYEQLGSLQERFKIFTTKDLVVGTAAFLNLNRDMGFTREELFKLQNAIATLAVVNGRSMDEVQRTVALALSSGYTEGLQRLGVSINRVTIANEAARMGYAKNYMALTEVQRAHATFNQIIQKTNIYAGELPTYINTASGAMDRLKTEVQELKNQFSLLIATGLGSFLLGVYDGIELINRGLKEYYESPAVKALQSLAERFSENIEKLKTINPLLITFVEWITKLSLVKAFPSPFDQIITSLFRILGIKEQLDKGLLGDEAVGETERQAKQIQDAVEGSLEELQQFQQDYADKVKDIETDYLRDIEKLERDAGRRRVELARDLARDLAEIERDGLQRREDLQQDYFNNLRKIGEDLARDIAEETAKYNLAVAQTIRDFALRRSEAEARYRENEIKAEIRFQEEMRRLREGFLFDLEDALHERDARQVLRLIRQYNLQKGQAERQAEIERDERRRAFELEMRELEAQRQERLRILAEEHAARIRALQEQAAYERELARRKYEEDKAELERKLEEEKQARIAKALEAEEELARKLEEAKTDRKALLDQQIADLEAERDRLLQEIGDKLWNSLQITTDEGLKQLYDALVASLGPDGGADQVFKYYAGAAEAAAKQVEGSLTRVAAMMAQIYAFVAQLNSLSGSSPGGGGGGGRGSTPIPNPNPNTRQSGGPVYAGEIYKVHKDETYVPAMNGRILSVQQSQQAVAQSRSPVGTGGEGSLKIRIGLSDGLIGEIVDMAGDVVSDVVFELERKRN